MMGSLLKLIGLGTGFNPLTIAITAAAIFAAGSLTGFATGWQVNGWRLGKEIATLEGKIIGLRAQVAVCGESLQRQNEAVGALGALGEQIRKGNSHLLAAIEKGSAGQRAQIGALQGLLDKPTPNNPDGSKAGCAEAWREIEARRVTR